MAISQQALLTLLSDGDWHSGEDLGRDFAVSRAAVWKHVQLLQEAGITVVSERGKGYQLPVPIHLLNADLLATHLSPIALSLLVDLRLEFSVESTNTEAMQQLINSPNECNGRVVFAEQQTAGRGRRGRHWVSPLGHNIYCSMSWGFTSGASSLSGLSLAVGLVTVMALESLGFNGIQLKWPNDLLWRGRKLGGILLEIVGDLAGPCQVVVGIGLNVTMSHSDPQKIMHSASHEQGINQPWVDLHEIDPQHTDRNRIAAVMLNQLLPMLADFERDGFSPLRSQWISRDAFLDQSVILQIGDQQIQGVSKGVADDGSLCLETLSGLHRFNGGEISLRASTAEGQS